MLQYDLTAIVAMANTWQYLVNKLKHFQYMYASFH
jgi:hypothetical protein